MSTTKLGYSMLDADLQSRVDAGGGSSAPVQTAFATAIPLDLLNRSMPLTPGAFQPITTNTVLTLAAGSIENGYCDLFVQYDGTHTLDYSAFYNPNSFTPASTAAGARVWFSFFVRGGVAQVLGFNQPAYTGAPSPAPAPSPTPAPSPSPGPSPSPSPAPSPTPSPSPSPSPSPAPAPSAPGNFHDARGTSGSPIFA